MSSVEAKLLEKYQNVMVQNETRTIALERQVAVRVSIPTSQLIETWVSLWFVFFR